MKALEVVFEPGRAVGVQLLPRYELLFWCKKCEVCLVGGRGLRGVGCGCEGVGEEVCGYGWFVSVSVYAVHFRGLVGVV